ncbi:Hypothetical protein NTJ_13302 [Nesidiocoris tenuis]|uniref:Uncharacterized protein n=1 Tax=Nesidiocoris tenuis TaxID=355587 RepID=A0ABN7B7X5_9HEMI|nr:Hypothetical protein NTJ_13302 [Nesidiocoris tenuis]
MHMHLPHEMFEILLRLKASATSENRTGKSSRLVSKFKLGYMHLASTGRLNLRSTRTLSNSPMLPTCPLQRRKFEKKTPFRRARISFTASKIAEWIQMFA